MALGHDDDVERRPVEDDVGALARCVQFDAEAVEFRRKVADKGNVAFGHVRFPSVREMSSADTVSNSPATSLRLSSLPTGDLGTSLTNTKSRGRLKLARFERRHHSSRAVAATGAERFTKPTSRWPQ